MTRTKVLKWYSEKFPFLFALLIPCHCHSNFNPFEDFISHTHELHLFYAWKRIECVQRKSHQWWIYEYWNGSKLLSEFGITTWAVCVEVFVRKWKQARVHQIRRHTNQIRKHVVHIFFRSVFSSTRRPNTCSSSRFSIGLHHPSNLEHLSTNAQRKECTLHTTKRRTYFGNAIECDGSISLQSVRVCVSHKVWHMFVCNECMHKCLTADRFVWFWFCFALFSTQSCPISRAKNAK